MNAPCPRCGGLFLPERIIDRREGFSYWQRRCVSCGHVKLGTIETSHVERPLEKKA